MRREKRRNPTRRSVWQKRTTQLTTSSVAIWRPTNARLNCSGSSRTSVSAQRWCGRRDNIAMGSCPARTNAVKISSLQGKKSVQFTSSQTFVRNATNTKRSAKTSGVNSETDSSSAVEPAPGRHSMMTRRIVLRRDARTIAHRRAPGKVEAVPYQASGVEPQTVGHPSSNTEPIARPRLGRDGIVVAQKTPTSTRLSKLINTAPDLYQWFASTGRSTTVGRATTAYTCIRSHGRLTRRTNAGFSERHSAGLMVPLSRKRTTLRSRRTSCGRSHPRRQFRAVKLTKVRRRRFANSTSRASLSVRS